MKLDSKYFDKIRVKPGEERLSRGKHPPCEWPGCAKPGRHRAPKGRNHEGQFQNGGKGAKPKIRLSNPNSPPLPINAAPSNRRSP